MQVVSISSTGRQALSHFYSTTLTVVTYAVLSIAPHSYDDVTIAHRCCVKHRAPVTSRYSALLLKLTVKDDDTSVTTATPELLVDDTQTPRTWWQLLLRLSGPLPRARLLQRQ